MKSTDNFNTYINHIDSDAWREVCVNKGMLRHYDKGEEFVSAGSVGCYMGFIVSGALKYVAYSDNGTEHVMGLVFGKGFVADWPFCLYGKKAKLSIVAVSDCEIYCIPVKVLKEIVDTDSRFKDIVMHSTEAVYATVYDRYVDLYCKSSRQRYNELLSRHPNLFDLFPLKDIASYLKITPTHLSRLRKDDN